MVEESTKNIHYRSGIEMYSHFKGDGDPLRRISGFSTHPIAPHPRRFFLADPDYCHESLLVYKFRKMD
jgi:hypothetical protein